MRRISIKRAKRLLQYDPLTGVIRWKVDGKLHIKEGDRADFKSGPRRCIFVDGIRYKAHVMAWFLHTGKWPIDKIDHKDRVPSHNWIDNLREATDQQNQQNKGKSTFSKSPYKGVSFHKASGKWRTHITVNYKRKYLGLFLSAESAAIEYNKWATKLFGEFASLNLVPETSIKRQLPKSYFKYLKNRQKP